MDSGTAQTTTQSGNFFGSNQRAFCRSQCDGYHDRQRKRDCVRDCLSTENTMGGTGQTEQPNQSGSGQTSFGGQYEAPQSMEQLGARQNEYGMQAPAGSPAAGMGQVGLNYGATNPYAATANYLNQQYGANPSSAATQQIYNVMGATTNRLLGLNGELFSNNIDAVNFGASLVQNSGLGYQFDPKAMVTNITEGISRAAQGTMDENSVGPGEGILANVAQNADPMAGLDALIGILEGALTGTMSDDALSGYLASLKAYGAQIIMGGGGFMNQTAEQLAQGEGSGGWFGQMVSALGPTLGL